MKEFTSAVVEIENEDGAPDRGPAIEFKLDGRVMKAYKPTDGQLVYLLASAGRGQGTAQRLAGSVNLLVSCLDDEDAAYIESRLLDPNPKTRLEVETVGEIFEYLSGEWFGTPTEGPSGSASSSASDTKRSRPTTTKSTSSE